jgi:hypothetical protein
MDYNKKLEETAKVFGDALGGDYRARGILKQVVSEGHAFNEAISTSDLARTFAYANGAELLKQYAGLPTTWTQFAKRDVFEDFKPKRKKEFLFNNAIDLADNGGFATPVHSLPNIPELTEYPTFRWSTSEKGLSLRKNGARIPFSWEDVINDEWGFIASLPGEMARIAKTTEETAALESLVTPTGVNTATFNSGNGNAMGTTGASGTRYKLSLNALEFAKREIRSRQVNGNYVTVNKFALIVPTNLQTTAERILALGSVEVTEGTKKYTTSVGSSDVTLVVNDYLTQINKDANAATTWFLVPLNGNDGTRDSIVVNFLRNHEKPEFRQSGNTGLYLGGGAVPSLEGSLLNDDIEYRVRHVVAGGFWFGASMYASTGESNAAAPDFLTPVV